MRANEFIIENASKMLSAQDDGKTITVTVQAPDGTTRTLSHSNPAVVQQWLNVKYGLRLPHSIARKFVGMPAPMAEDQADNPDSWESQAADAEREEETVRMSTQDAQAGGVAEGISLDALAKVGNLIPSFAQKLGIAAKQEAQETRDMLNILKLKMQGKPVTPEQIKFMNKQWKDLAIIALGVGTIGYATAAAGVAHGAAAAVSHGAKDALIHGIADIGLEAAAEVLAAKFGINIVKNLTHGLATSTGQGYEHGQEHAPAQYGVSPAVAAQNQANLEKKFQQAKMGFGGMAEEQLDEKSTSQAQFRTMAAAAHNPKFAKKVGISPDVAREFHGADKKSDYKSLPMKATAGEIDEVLGFVISRPKQTKKPVTSLATMRKEFEKDKSGTIEKSAQGQANLRNVKYVRTTTGEDASWGQAPESKGYK